jgi:hypothetical protein
MNGWGLGLIVGMSSPEVRIRKRRRLGEDNDAVDDHDHDNCSASSASAFGQQNSIGDDGGMAEHSTIDDSSLFMRVEVWWYTSRNVWFPEQALTHLHHRN